MLVNMPVNNIYLTYYSHIFESIYTRNVQALLNISAAITL